MRARWEKYGDFHISLDLGGKTILAYSQKYTQHYPESSIKKIELLGYKDGRFVIFIAPINNATFPKISNAFNNFLYADISVDQNVMITIQDETHLLSFLNVINQIDTIAESMRYEIVECFQWLKNRQNSKHTLLPHTYEQSFAKQNPVSGNKKEDLLLSAVQISDLPEIKRLLQSNLNITDDQAVQTRWKKNGDFHIRWDRGIGTILICSQQYTQQHPETSIGQIEILGYKDGRFVVFIKPINLYTFPNISNTLINSPYVEISKLDQNVTITIQDETHLLSSLNVINQIDTISESMRYEIVECFNWFKNSQDSDQVMVPSIYFQSFFKHKQIPSLNEKEVHLVSAVENGDLPEIKRLLQSNLNPNITNDEEKTLLTIAFWKYIAKMGRGSKEEAENWYQIMKILMQYGADPEIMHPDFTDSVISSASEAHCNDVVDLILKHKKDVSFRLPECYDPKEYYNPKTQQTSELLRKHFKRITNCNQQKLNRQSDIVAIQFNEAEGATRFVRKNGEVITAVLKNNRLAKDEMNALFDLYLKTFSVKDINSTEELKKYFFQKMGFDGSRNVYIYIIKNSANEMIGYNCFELHETFYENNPCIISYGSLAYIDAKYRGAGVTTPLSFGAILALKIALENNPDIQLYEMYDAIHLNSYRLISDLKPQYPLHRYCISKGLVKHILTLIYGQERAKKYDGEQHVYLETKSSVNENLPSPDNYDLPWMIDLFKELTENKGGIPVIFPVTHSTCDYFIKKLHPDFEKYIQQLGQYLLKNNFISSATEVKSLSPL